MVLLGSYYLRNATGLREGLNCGVKIEGFNLSLSKLFNLCEGCKETMSCIPPSAFSAGRIRETQQRSSDMKISNPSTGAEPSKFFSNMMPELSPLKYNSKLMNSIWGLYNRYSPHNVKKINDAECGPLSQSAGGAGKSEPRIALPSPALDMWPIPTPQSH